MRVDPFHLDHSAPQLDRALGVELGCKRMMREDGSRQRKHEPCGSKPLDQFGDHRCVSCSSGAIDAAAVSIVRRGTLAEPEVSMKFSTDFFVRFRTASDKRVDYFPSPWLTARADRRKGLKTTAALQDVLACVLLAASRRFRVIEFVQFRKGS